MSQPEVIEGAEESPQALNENKYKQKMIGKGINIVELTDAYVYDRLRKDFYGDTSHWAEVYIEFAPFFNNLSDEEKIALIERLFPNEG